MPRPIALVVLALLAGCAAASDDPTATPAPGAARVVRHVDGDTLVVAIDDREEPVRLIGIDTPETVAQDRPVECFGPEASARLAELLPVGTDVRLERDVEARDRFDRLLAYVVRADDGAVINVVMVEEGFAESVSYPPNLARQGELDRAEADARTAQRGLWPACGGTDVPVEG